MRVIIFFIDIIRRILKIIIVFDTIENQVKSSSNIIVMIFIQIFKNGGLAEVNIDHSFQSLFSEHVVIKINFSLL
jgi:hypothetical protein